MAGWFYHGTRNAKPEYWRAAERQNIDPSSPHMQLRWNKWESPREQRSMTTVPGSQGGYTVAVDQSLLAKIDVALKYYGNLFQYCSVIDTPTGAPLPWNVVDDTGNQAEISGEANTMNATDVTVGNRMLSAFKYDTMVKWSIELEQDSILNLADFIGDRVGRRIAVKFNSDAINAGAGGANGPNPLTNTATSCGTTTASNSAVTLAELLSLFHGVDIAYRDSPGCGWLFADATLKILRSLVDTAGRPLLNSSLEGISGGIPVGMKTLLEKPYYVNQAVPSGASAKAYFFGDLSKILVRRVTGGNESELNLVRLNERFIADGLYALLAWARFDSMLSDAGEHPVQYMTNHS